MTANLNEAIQLQPVLRIQNLSAGYGSKVVLDEISFDVMPGEIIALLGINGAGKSTCFKTMIGLLRPLHGAVILDSADTSRRAPAHNARAGLILVPEGGRSFSDLTVRENLELCRFVVSNVNVFRDRLAEVMATFPRLENRLNERAGTLSGGERQMLAIGRALVLRPRVLLLDEPFLGLAPIMINEVIKQLAELKRNVRCGIVLAEQNVAATMRTADRVLLVRDGQVEEAQKNISHANVHGLLLGQSPKNRENQGAINAVPENP
jgi:branched-chain amino acid transport system ATP-binding protein